MTKSIRCSICQADNFANFAVSKQEPCLKIYQKDLKGHLKY